MLVVEHKPCICKKKMKEWNNKNVCKSECGFLQNTANECLFARRLKYKWRVGGCAHQFCVSSPRFMSAILRGAVAIQHTIVLGLFRPHRSTSWQLLFGVWFLGVVQGACFILWLLLGWCIFLWVGGVKLILRLIVSSRNLCVVPFRFPFLSFCCQPNICVLQSVVWYFLLIAVTLHWVSQKGIWVFVCQHTLWPPLRWPRGLFLPVQAVGQFLKRTRGNELSCGHCIWSSLETCCCIWKPFFCKDALGCKDGYTLGSLQTYERWTTFWFGDDATYA